MKTKQTPRLLKALENLTAFVEDAVRTGVLNADEMKDNQLLVEANVAIADTQKAQHTPGPWELIGRHIVARTKTPYQKVAEVEEVSPLGVEIANTNLIVAAPEMLRALKMLHSIEEFKHFGHEEQVVVLNAINKAEGKQS